MNALFALVGTALAGLVTFLSFKAMREAERTGRLRLLFWHIPGWGERERDPGFFRAGLRMNLYRTGFFGFVTVMAAVYAIEVVLGLAN